MAHEWNMSMEQWWEKLEGKMEVLGDKIFPIASSSSTNLTWNLKGRKVSLCSERLSVWFISQSVFNAMYTQIIPIIPANHGSLNFLWQRATPVIVGWFEGQKCKIIVNDVLNCLNSCEIFIVLVYAQFISVCAVRIIQRAGPRIGSWCCKC
jgi:hypothetical protein